MIDNTISYPTVSLTPKIVLVIGNGFDLDLHLKTSYNDFVNSIAFKPMTDATFYVCKDYLDYTKFTPRIQLYPNRLSTQIKEQANHNNWVDLELEIKKFCYNHKDEVNSVLIAKEIFAIRYFLYKYIQFNGSFSSTQPANDKSIAYQVLNYFKENNSDVEIWNFNYSDNCEYLLEIIGIKDKYKVNHIHGSIEESGRMEDVNIVVGTNYDKVVSLVCRSAIKSDAPRNNYQQKVTSLQYDLENAETLILFGFGVGETDQHYFAKTLKQTTKLKKIAIIEHTENSISNVMNHLDDASDNRIGKMIENGDIEKLSFTTNDCYDDVCGTIKKDKLLELSEFLRKCCSCDYKELKLAAE